MCFQGSQYRGRCGGLPRGSTAAALHPEPCHACGVPCSCGHLSVTPSVTGTLLHPLHLSAVRAGQAGSPLRGEPFPWTAVWPVCLAWAKPPLATISLECQHSPAGKRLPVHPSISKTQLLYFAFSLQNYTLHPGWALCQT